MARVRDVDPRRCLVVPVDVGKWSAMALVADHHGEVVRAPLEFRLDEPGVRWLLSLIAGAASDVDAWCVGWVSSRLVIITVRSSLASAAMALRSSSSIPQR